MALVLDIETVGQERDAIPDRALDYLFRALERDDPPEEEIARRREELVSRFGLDPTTGRVVCIGTLDTEAASERTFVDGDEKRLLEGFWAWLEAARPSLIVTFNGRGFDLPYLQVRSAVHALRPAVTFKDLRHLDLRRALEGDDRRRRGSLDYFCAIFGIASPKTELDGSMIGEAFARGEIDAIARYCLEDCRATAALYERLRPFYDRGD